MSKKRFVETYSQGVTNCHRIIVDTETGVNYLIVSEGSMSSRGVTVLVDQDGKPLIMPMKPKE